MTTIKTQNSVPTMNSRCNTTRMGVVYNTQTNRYKYVNSGMRINNDDEKELEYELRNNERRYRIEMEIRNELNGMTEDELEEYTQGYRKMLLDVLNSLSFEQAMDILEDEKLAYTE